MRFVEPWYLLLLIPFLATFWLARRRRAWRDPELGVSSLSAVPTTAGVRASVARVWPGLRPLAVALILIAAARPQAGREMREVVSEGIDIMLAIDISGSMRSEDFRPKNRLYVAKQVAKEFVRGRQQDRIGLLAFAGQSELISPLTLDYDGLASLIDGLDFGQLPDGTAVGAAIAQSAERLHRPFPVDDPLLGRHYVWVQSEVDETTLQAVAQETGGRYFRATSAELLGQVYREIGALEPSRVETRSYTRWAEMGPLALGVGLGLLGLELLFGFTLLRRYP